MKCPSCIAGLFFIGLTPFFLTWGMYLKYFIYQRLPSVVILFFLCSEDVSENSSWAIWNIVWGFSLKKKREKVLLKKNPVWRLRELPVIVLQATAPFSHDVASETVTLQHSCHECGDMSLSFLQHAAFEQRKSRPPVNGGARQRLLLHWVLCTPSAPRLTPFVLAPRPTPFAPCTTPLDPRHTPHSPLHMSLALRPSPHALRPSRSIRHAFLRVCRRRRWSGRHATSSGRNRLWEGSPQATHARVVFPVVPSHGLTHPSRTSPSSGDIIHTRTHASSH